MPDRVAAELVSDFSHPIIQRVLQLRDSRAARDQTGLFFAEGAGFLFHAVRARLEVRTVVVAAELLRDRLASRLVEDLVNHGVPCLAVTTDLYLQLSISPEPQGVGFIAAQRWTSLRRANASDGLCWLAAFRLKSPGNLGTLLRTSAAVGGAGLIAIGEHVDPFHPGTIRGSMGALFRQQLVRTDAIGLSRWAERQGCCIIGTSPRASRSLYRLPRQMPLMICVGHEGEGMSPEETALCDLVVRIPMFGPMDSLNVGVAGSVLLYEVLRQRRR